MQVQLDEEIWEMNDSVRLEEVLANLSDRAQAKGRLVTELMVGNQKMTDRELVFPTLAQVASSFGSIAAKSEALENIVQHSTETAQNFGHQLRLQAQDLVSDFRQGHGVLRVLDQWFGQVADYLEWAQIQKSVGTHKPDEGEGLSFWVNELMNARTGMDKVRIADILEYEMIPRLPGHEHTSL